METNIKNKIDKEIIELVAAVSLEITDRYRLIMKLFSNENHDLLKHLAASSIHMSWFMRDLYEHVEGISPSDLHSELEEKFLDKCGCDIKNVLQTWWK